MTLKRPLPGDLEIHLQTLRDPRVERTKRFTLPQVLFMAFAAVLAGCNGPDAIAAFAAAKRSWFEQWFDLPDGTPCGDTFERLLARLAPKPFAAAFAAWLAALRQHVRGELLALDGKAIKGAFDRAARTTPLHLLHVWSVDRQTLLAKRAVAGAPGEVGAIAELLAQLDVAGCVIAADANGATQKNAGAAIDAAADYLFGLKGNRGPIHAATCAAFAALPPATATDPAVDVAHDKGHGRRETRTTRVLPATVLAVALRGKWPGLTTLVEVRRQRVSRTHETDETHYFLTSLPPDAAALGARTRAYWSVENQLHWILDVTMGEDRCRVRHLGAAENWATMRRSARDLLGQPGAGPGSIAMKQRIAGWDERYLLTLLCLSEATPGQQGN